MQGPFAIILAAGQGKRMKSEKAKVLHEVCGRPMIHRKRTLVQPLSLRTLTVFEKTIRKFAPVSAWERVLF